MNTSLFLFPLPPLDVPPDMKALVQVLQRNGVAGGLLGPGRYAVGKRFFNYMTFAGCSPHLLLDPPPDGGWQFCHVQLHGDESPQLRITPQRGRPRCPVCRSSVPGWKEYLHEWKRDGSLVICCSSCDCRIPVAELDWRQYGLAARCRVEIHQVYPGEALPQDSLLLLLQEATGREWAYAWAES
jgi:hypothetical protein